MNAVIYAGVAVSGAFSVLAGGLTVGGLSAFLSYANQYTKPFNEISGVITELQGAFACAARLFELINTPAEVDAAAAPNPAQRNEKADSTGNVSFRNVCFSYTPDTELIRDFSLEVKSGMRVAIVGPTGCGKTTLINLLMRFYDVNSGEILIDGVETRSMPRHELRKNSAWFFRKHGFRREPFGKTLQWAGRRQRKTKSSPPQRPVTRTGS